MMSFKTTSSSDYQVTTQGFNKTPMLQNLLNSGKLLLYVCHYFVICASLSLKKQKVIAS